MAAALNLECAAPVDAGLRTLYRHEYAKMTAPHPGVHLCMEELQGPLALRAAFIFGPVKLLIQEAITALTLGRIAPLAAIVLMDDTPNACRKRYKRPFVSDLLNSNYRPTRVQNTRCLEFALTDTIKLRPERPLCAISQPNFTPFLV